MAEENNYKMNNQQQQQKESLLSPSAAAAVVDVISRSTNNNNTDEAMIIDGKYIASLIQQELSDEVVRLKREHNGIVPGLAVVLVGNRMDSMTYVKMKKKMATTIGIHSIDISLPETSTEKEVIQEIEKLNLDPLVHGILVQLPLPNHMNEYNVLNTISINKDVDGFAPTNIGNLQCKGGVPPLAVPCTPAGCIELLQRYHIPIKGKDCIVLGRSNIVGMPMAALLQSCNGTVTVCHSHTTNIEEKIKQADIIIAAIGKPEYVHGSWCKPGCVILDVGINSITDTTKKSGYKLVGDVHYESCSKVASYITPVPGGVGPMTIIMLMKNTINLTRHSLTLSRLPLRNEMNK